MQIPFLRFFSNLADLLLQKLRCPQDKFGIKTTEELQKHIQCECDEFVLSNIEVTTVDKILKRFGIDQTSVKYPSDGAPVIAIHFDNINLLIKFNTFP